MSLKSRVCCFIAVAVIDPAILAGASRAGRRAGLPAIVDNIFGGALSGLLPAAVSQPGDTPEHVAHGFPGNARGGQRSTIPTLRVLRRLLAESARNTHGSEITARRADIDPKDESRPPRRFCQVAEGGAERTPAALIPARIRSLPARASGFCSILFPLVNVSGWLSARWGDGHLALGRTFTNRRVAQLGWAG
jgi:hypothetical protein